MPRQASQPLPPIAPYKGRKAARYWEKAPDDNYTNPNYHKIFDWSCFGRILLVTVVITAVMYVLYLAYYCGMLMIFRGRSIQEIYSSQTPEVTTDGLDYLFFLLGLINILVAAPICQAVGMRGRHPSKVTYWRDRPEIEPMVAAWGFGKRTYLGSGIASLIDKGAVGVDSQGHIYLRGTPSRPLTPPEIKLMGFLAVAFGDFYREHPDFAGAPDGSDARVNPSVAELTDHLSPNGFESVVRRPIRDQQGVEYHHVFHGHTAHFHAARVRIRLRGIQHVRRDIDIHRGWRLREPDTDPHPI